MEDIPVLLRIHQSLRFANHDGLVDFPEHVPQVGIGQVLIEFSFAAGFVQQVCDTPDGA